MRVNPQRQFLSQKCLPTYEYRRPESAQRFDDQSTVSIGDYKFSMADCVGKGSFSKVFSAKHNTTNEKVAVKLINTKSLKDKPSEDLLRNEMNTIKELHHPYILCCLDIYVTEATTYIVTEFCDSDLAKLIKNTGMLMRGTAYNFFVQIVKGYHHMRQKGYIHRDLKPANLLLRKNTIKIADFGFSKVSLNSSPIKQRFNVGSPLYMAPQALRDNIYSEKSDVWSLGVILFEMLTGKVPFRATTQKQLIHQMTKINIGELTRQKIPLQFQTILEGCLATDLKKRLSMDRLIEVMRIDPSDLDYSSTPIHNQLEDFFKKIDKVLINELNYVEFLRKLRDLLPEDQEALKIKYIVGKNLKTRVGKLGRIQTKENAYDMPKWEHYVKKPNFNTYVSAITKLQKLHVQPEYPAVLFDKRLDSLHNVSKECEKLLLAYQYYLRQYIGKCKEDIVDLRNSPKFQESLLLIDFLVSAYQLNCLHMQYLNEPFEFADRSYLGLIVNGQIKVDESVWDLLQKKMQRLEL